MNYYITLPSSGADLQSEYGKKNNTQTDFFTKLGKSIDISNQEYEVALVEISFRVSWLVNLGSFEIISSNPIKNFKQDYKKDITVIDYENLSKLTIIQFSFKPATLNSLKLISVMEYENQLQIDKHFNAKLDFKI